MKNKKAFFTTKWITYTAMLCALVIATTFKKQLAKNRLLPNFKEEILQKQNIENKPQEN